MPRALPISDQDGNHHGWYVHCPGCGYAHVFDKRWTFNGNLELPTFRPSMLVNAGLYEEQNPDGSKKYPGTIRCHSFVTDGKIQFLSDCSHGLAGQTLDLCDPSE